MTGYLVFAAVLVAGCFVMARIAEWLLGDEREAGNEWAEFDSVQGWRRNVDRDGYSEWDDAA